MFLTQCPLCEHVNPPDSRFCNACGAPLNLAPCPHCGALNDLADQACHKCAGDLSTVRKRLPHDDAAPSVVAAASDAEVLATLKELRRSLGRAESGSGAGKPVEADGAGPATIDDREVPVAAWVGGPAPSSVPVRAELTPVRAVPRTSAPQRARRLAGVAVLAALAIAGLYTLLQRPTDERPPVAAGDSKGPSGPAVGGLIGGAGVANVGETASVTTREAAATPGPAEARLPEPAARAVVERPIASEATTAKAERKVEPPVAATAPATAASASAVAPIPGTRHGGRVAESPDAAAAVAASAARPAAPDRGAGIQPPSPSVGPCTEQVAALGLCKPESIEGRQ